MSTQPHSGPMEKSPYYHLVPKDEAGHLKHRRWWLKYGYRGPKAAAKVRKICSKDLLFYVNTFCWTYDPRRFPTCVPFNTYGYQDNEFLELQAAIEEGRDTLWEKSRDMGVSWIILTGLQWFWSFRNDLSFLLGSRKEEYVDKPGDVKSLFGKIDYLMERLPGYLIPSCTRTALYLKNLGNGSVFSGESTNMEFARGDRRTAIMLDEFAFVENGHAILRAVRDATNCRLFCSTPNGIGNAFYDLTQGKIRKRTLHWTQHPLKSRGLYYDAKGKPRSPWYDKECERSGSAMEIASELDIAYRDSDCQWFDADILQRVQRDDVRPPYVVGDVTFEEYGKQIHNTQFVPRDNGKLRLWLYPDAQGNPPRHDYVIGADVAAGSTDSEGRGASNSVLSIGDKVTHEKIGEFAVAGLKPYELARVTVAIVQWLSGSDTPRVVVNWENSGPGQEYGEELVRLGFSRFHYERDDLDRKRKVSSRPGWFPTPEHKKELLGEYRRVLARGEFKNRSYEAIKECEFYTLQAKTGQLIHVRSATTIDPTGARDNHGDRVIADALCWWTMRRSEPGGDNSENGMDQSDATSLFARRQARLRRGSGNRLCDRFKESQR